MSKLELRIPPPAVLAICAVLAWLARTLLPTQLDFGGAETLAATLAFTGFALAASAIVSFKRADTTIDPMKPDKSSSVVTHGVFRFTRNPMYLALLLVLCGWVVYAGSAFGLAVPFLFIAYITKFQILPEEKALAAKFGQPYTDYCRKVRRWI